MKCIMAVPTAFIVLLAASAARLPAAQALGCEGCLPTKCLVLDQNIVTCFKCEDNHTLKLLEDRSRVCIPAPLVQAMGYEDGPDELAPETSPVTATSPQAAAEPAAEQSENWTSTKEVSAWTPTAEAPAAHAHDTSPTAENTPAPVSETQPSEDTPVDTSDSEGSEDEMPAEPSSMEVVSGAGAVDDEPDATSDPVMETEMKAVPETEIYIELDSVSPVDEFDA